jgi:hypothetical protein
VVPKLDSGSSPTIVRNKISENLDTAFAGMTVLMGPVPEFLTPAFADGDSSSGSGGRSGFA